MTYPITIQLIPGLPHRPYRKGPGKPEGIVFHCTDTPGRPDTAATEASHEQRTWQQAFVHFFVDDASIVQVANTDFLCFGAGPNGNSRFVQIELCMLEDPAKFQEMYQRSIWLGASLLHQYGLSVSPAPEGTVWSHQDVSRYLGGTDHEDPVHYLQSHGISWNRHLQTLFAEWSKPVNKPASNPTCRPVSQPAYRKLSVLVNGRFYAAIDVDDTTYVVWTALNEFNTPYEYRGNGLMTVRGQDIQGVVFGGSTYLPWSCLAPGIHAAKVDWSFTV